MAAINSDVTSPGRCVTKLMMEVGTVTDNCKEVPPRILRSPWLSVSDMLISNKCWLCNTPFQRGYKKKVFMVSQLVSTLVRLGQEAATCTENGEQLREFTSVNFHACYKSFSTEFGFDEARLAAELKKQDVAYWLSGLVCCRSATCSEEFEILLPSGSAVIKPQVNRKPVDGEYCPPDCDCDNPWPFLSG